MKYKEGDEVRFIKNLKDNNVHLLGKSGKVTIAEPAFEDDKFPYKTTIDPMFWFGESELELVSPDLPEPIEEITQKYRGFQALPGYEDVPLPTRATKYSAGYDLAVTEDITLLPGETKVYTTGLCAYMLSDEYLAIHVRSSLGIKHRITLSNSTGIVDSDYIQSDNGGHIMMALTNNGSDVFQAAKGSRVAQGIFMKYLVADGDNVTTERNGGWGSTGN